MLVADFPRDFIPAASNRSAPRREQSLKKAILSGVSAMISFMLVQYQGLNINQAYSTKFNSGNYMKLILAPECFVSILYMDPKFKSFLREKIP